MSHLKIPMSPADFPPQRLYQVKSLPILRAGCAAEIMNYEREHTLAGIPKKPTRKSVQLPLTTFSPQPTLSYRLILMMPQDNKRQE